MTTADTTVSTGGRVGGGSIDASWLVRLRWALTATQFVVVFFVDRLRGTHIHVVQALAFLAVGAASNIVFAVWLARDRDLRDRTLGLVLAFDVVLLTAVLAEGGGYAATGHGPSWGCRSRARSL
jgi:hypothetical protein